MSAPICHIVCAGPCARLRVELGEGDLLVAADGGYMHCIDAGIVPHLFIGDLDSLPAQLAKGIECERRVLPCEKDITDTQAACEEGLRRGYAEFRIYAALGGDVGHELANMQLLAFLHERGGHGVLHGDTQQVRLVTPQSPIRSFTADAGTRVSVFAFGAVADGVSLRGLHWELADAQMSPRMPIGVSNRVESGSFDIEVKAGSLLVVIG